MPTAGLHQATISAVEREERIPGIDVPLAVCRVLEITPDQLLRRAGLLPAEGEYPDEGFWELWWVYKRLTLRCAQGCAAEDQAEVVRYAHFREGERG
jgi:transcriptional regulator with XRE-family HTH domain